MDDGPLFLLSLRFAAPLINLLVSLLTDRSRDYCAGYDGNL